jgi:hypothetical protein
MEVMGMIATLIFVVILAQIELRGKISTDKVVYMEYYYFVVYAALFTVLINYLLFNKESLDIKIIKYGNNYIPKILFLPTISLTVFIITWIIFY